MANSRETRLRIAASVLFATGFWDAIAGRFLFQPRSQNQAPFPLPPADSVWEDWRGALHVHSTYSDGAGNIPTVMDAATAAGVDFLLLCDHNTQQPLRDGWEPCYPDKPMLLIGTEVTVEHGAFILALDMPPQWEPTKGQVPQAAIDEVNEHHGLPLVSLPFDVKHPWREWNATGYEGLEVINFSTIARRHINLLSLLWLLPIYRLFGMQAVLRALVTRPDQALARWDSLTTAPSQEGESTRSIGIGALDAHALMKIGKKKYPLPSYEDTFRAVMTHVLLPPNPPSGARAAIYDAFRQGRCYFSYDCLGDPTGVRFYATTNAEGIDAKVAAVMGERVTRSDDAPLTLVAEAQPGLLLRLYRNGRIVASGRKGRLTYTVQQSGVYRVEGYQYTARVGPLFFGARPYFFTNPIYVDATGR